MRFWSPLLKKDCEFFAIVKRNAVNPLLLFAFIFVLNLSKKLSIISDDTRYYVKKQRKKEKKSIFFKNTYLYVCEAKCKSFTQGRGTAFGLCLHFYLQVYLLFVR